MSGLGKVERILMPIKHKDDTMFVTTLEIKTGANKKQNDLVEKNSIRSFFCAIIDFDVNFYTV